MKAAHQSPWLRGTPANDVLPMQSKMAVGQNVAPTDLTPSSVSAKFAEPGSGGATGDTPNIQPTQMARRIVTPNNRPPIPFVRLAADRARDRHGSPGLEDRAMLCRNSR
jgi:hypothetical protein